MVEAEEMAQESVVLLLLAPLLPVHRSIQQELGASIQKFLNNSNNTRGRGKTAYKGDEDLEDKPPPDNQNFIPPPHKPYFTLLATTVMFALFVWELVRAISPWSWKNPWLWGSVTNTGVYVLFFNEC